MSTIEFRNLGKQYIPNGPWTINAANLQIKPGAFCVFVGPSGCGKSTLLRMIAGLESITSGEMHIDGRRVNDLPPAQRGVAMVFQSYALYPHMRVYENMAFGLRVAGSNKDDIDRRVRRAAESLQLTPLLDRLPRMLSGGQRQRVAIGRAIVKEPKVFLFDEPLSNLDAALRVQTRLEIARLHREIGSASMIYVTHDQVEAMTLADQMVLLNTGDSIDSEGSIAQVGTPMELYHRPASRFVADFIGSPKINLLDATLVDAQPDYATLSFAGRHIKAAVDARHLLPGCRVQLGVRPEHLAIVPATESLTASVVHSERLGDVSLLYAELPGTTGPVTVRVEGSAPAGRGAAIQLRIDPEHGHLFDESGRACRRTVPLPS